MEVFSGKILIVDDDLIQCWLLQEVVIKFGYCLKIVENGVEVMCIMFGLEVSEIDLIIFDMVMFELDGLGVLECFCVDKIVMLVIVQIVYGGIDMVVNVMNVGVQDFVVKLVVLECFNVLIRNFLKILVLEGEIIWIQKKVFGMLIFVDIVIYFLVMEWVISLGC